MSTNISAFVSNYGLLAVFVGTFIEGEGILITAGILAGGGLLHPVSVWLTASLGAWLGHGFWFIVGRNLRNQPARFRYQWLGERINQADRIIQRRPGTSIFTLQYLYGLRIIGAIAFGFTHLSIGRFLFYEALNCPLWAALTESLGYLLGDVVISIFHGWAKWIWMFVSVVVVLLVFHHLKPNAFGKSKVV
jgi:membrane protein DedA with SNARE-associated domain